MKKTLAYISLSLMLGIIAGSLTAVYAADASELTEFFGAMADNARDGVLHNSLLRVLLPNLLWPALIMLMSFSIVGVAGIPLCAMFKGFLVSYTASSVIRAFGINGIWLALVSAGTPNILYIPLLLFISIPAVELSANAPKRPRSAYYIRFAAAAVIFTGISAYQAYLQPLFITKVILKYVSN